jgi:carboxylesterase
VAGLSLGALLALDLAAGRPVAGVAVYSPPLAVGNPLIRLSWAYGWIPVAIPQAWTGTAAEDPEIDRRTWCYDRLPLPAIRQVHLLTERVRRLLPAVTAPALVVMSRGDRSLRFEGAEMVMEGIGSQEKRLVTLTESGHNVLIDRERERVWEETAGFLEPLTTLKQG